MVTLCPGWRSSAVSVHGGFAETLKVDTGEFWDDCAVIKPDKNNRLAKRFR
jgi:hypothetical protein